MDHAAWNEKLAGLAEHVEDHIGKEEGDIFSAARQLFNAAQIAELAPRWHTAKQEYMARHAK
jgi:hemerythrin-like domain-containing protein